MITDVIDDAEVKNGVREDGTIYSVYSFARKVGQALSSGMEGGLLTMIGYTGAVELLWRMCRAFREQYPRVRFELHTAASDVIRERLERGLADIGLLLEPVDMERFSYIRLPEREQWVALLPPGDPLTAKDAVTAEDLAPLPLILPERLTMQSELASWPSGRSLQRCMPPLPWPGSGSSPWAGRRRGSFSSYHAFWAWTRHKNKVFDIIDESRYNADMGSGAPRCPHFLYGRQS